MDSKICEFCHREFIPKDKRQRFCSNSCSAKWRIQTYGPTYGKISDEQRRKNSEILKQRWKDPEFREKKVRYMKEHNPVHIPGVIEKANKTRLSHGKLPNNYKYGNGKISKYEQSVYNDLIKLGFYYNYCINTKLARDAFPERHYAKGYKPDFVNIKDHLCIEIDGNNHQKESARIKDRKKEECLQFLGFNTIRFTHKQIEEGEFKRWLDLYQRED